MEKKETERNYQKVKDQLNELMDNNYEDFVKAMVSIEKNIEDEEMLDRIYNKYREEDGLTGILNEEFDEFVETIEEEYEEFVEIAEEEIVENIEVAEEVIHGNSDINRRRAAQRLNQFER